MALTGYAIGGIVMIVIGIVLLIAGIVLLAIDQSNQTVSEWWVWALIVIGVIALLVGIALFFIPEPKTNMEKHMAKHMASGSYDPCNPCPPPPCPPPPCPRVVEVEPICPPPPCNPCAKPNPCNPCNPCEPECYLEVEHTDPCKQRAFEEAHMAKMAPLARSIPQVMPQAPVEGSRRYPRNGRYLTQPRSQRTVRVSPPARRTAGRTAFPRSLRTTRSV